ncbi:MAG: XTP/dITP diphosphatase [Candidatus Bathyarchaeota archaeon]|nr:XTP/dITP diphosphatase [Candidatus Bathyarchaeota archaeon]
MNGSFELKGKVVIFATGNIHKFNEARVVLAQHGIATGMLRAKAVEIQSDSLTEIASVSAQDAYKRCRLPLIVEDAGLFVDALKGFPGPYAAYVYQTVANKGLLKLMENVKDRKATFRSAIAYCDSENGETVCFTGQATGEITTQEQTQDKSAFGFDPVFQPEGKAKTFAEMTLEEKNRVSHRAQAIHKFAEWYIKQGHVKS